MEETTFAIYSDPPAIPYLDFITKIDSLLPYSPNNSEIIREIREYISTRDSRQIPNEIGCHVVNKLIDSMKIYLSKNGINPNLSSFIIRIFNLLFLLGYHGETNSNIVQFYDIICQFLTKCDDEFLPTLIFFLYDSVKNQQEEFQNIKYNIINKIIPPILSKLNQIMQNNSFFSKTEYSIFLNESINIFHVVVSSYRKTNFPLPYDDIFSVAEQLRNFFNNTSNSANIELKQSTSITTLIKYFHMKIFRVYLNAFSVHFPNPNFDLEKLIPFLMTIIKTTYPIFTHQIIEGINAIILILNATPDIPQVYRIILNDFAVLSNYLRLRGDLVEVYVKLFSLVFEKSQPNLKKSRSPGKPKTLPVPKKSPSLGNVNNDMNTNINPGNNSNINQKSMNQNFGQIMNDNIMSKKTNSRKNTNDKPNLKHNTNNFNQNNTILQNYLQNFLQNNPNINQKIMGKQNALNQLNVPNSQNMSRSSMINQPNSNMMNQQLLINQHNIIVQSNMMNQQMLMSQQSMMNQPNMMNPNMMNQQNMINQQNMMNQQNIMNQQNMINQTNLINQNFIVQPNVVNPKPTINQQSQVSPQLSQQNAPTIAINILNEKDIAGIVRFIINLLHYKAVGPLSRVNYIHSFQDIDIPFKYSFLYLYATNITIYETTREIHLINLTNLSQSLQTFQRYGQYCVSFSKSLKFATQQLQKLCDDIQRKNLPFYFSSQTLYKHNMKTNYLIQTLSDSIYLMLSISWQVLNALQKGDNIQLPEKILDTYQLFSQITKIILFRDKFKSVLQPLYQELTYFLSILPSNLIMCIFEEFFTKNFTSDGILNFPMEFFLKLKDKSLVFVTFLESFLKVVTDLLNDASLVEKIFQYILTLFKQLSSIPIDKTILLNYSTSLQAKFTNFLKLCKEFHSSIVFCDYVFKIYEISIELSEHFFGLTNCKLACLNTNFIHDICRSAILIDCQASYLIPFIHLCILKNSEILKQNFIIETLILYIDKDPEIVAKLLNQAIKMEKKLVYSHYLSNILIKKSIELLDITKNIETKKNLLKILRHISFDDISKFKKINSSLISQQILIFENNKTRFEFPFHDFLSSIETYFRLKNNQITEKDFFICQIVSHTVTSIFQSHFLSCDQRKIIVLFLNNIMKIGKKNENELHNCVHQCILKILSSAEFDISTYAHVFSSLCNTFLSPPQDLISIIFLMIRTIDEFRDFIDELHIILDFQLFSMKNIGEIIASLIIENITFELIDPVHFALFIYRFISTTSLKSTVSEASFSLTFPELNDLSPNAQKIITFTRDIFATRPSSLSLVLDLIFVVPSIAQTLVIFEIISKIKFDSEILNFSDQLLANMNIEIGHKYRLVGLFIRTFPKIFELRKDKILSFVGTYSNSNCTPKQQASFLCLLNAILILDNTAIRDLMNYFQLVTQFIERNQPFYSRQAHSILYQMYLSNDKSVEYQINHLFNEYSQRYKFLNDSFIDFKLCSILLYSFYQIYPDKIFQVILNYLLQVKKSFKKTENQSIQSITFENSLHSLISFLSSSNVIMTLINQNLVPEFLKILSNLYLILNPSLANILNTFFITILCLQPKQFTHLLNFNFNDQRLLQFFVLFFQNNKNDQIIFEIFQKYVKELHFEKDESLLLYQVVISASIFHKVESDHLTQAINYELNLFKDNILLFDPIMFQQHCDLLITHYPDIYIKTARSIIQFGYPILTNQYQSSFLNYIEFIEVDHFQAFEVTKNEFLNESFMDKFIIPYFIKFFSKRSEIINLVNSMFSSYIYSSFLLILVDRGIPIKQEAYDIFHRSTSEISKFRTLLFWSKHTTEYMFDEMFKELISFISINTSLEIINVMKNLIVPENHMLPQKFFLLFEKYRSYDNTFNALCQFIVNNKSYAQFISWELIQLLLVELDKNFFARKTSHLNDLLPQFQFLYLFLPKNRNELSLKNSAMIYHFMNIIKSTIQISNDLHQDFVKTLIGYGIEIIHLFGGKCPLTEDLFKFFEEVLQCNSRIHQTLITLLPEIAKLIAINGTDEKKDFLFSICDKIISDNPEGWPHAIISLFTIISSWPKKMIKRLKNNANPKIFPILWEVKNALFEDDKYRYLHNVLMYCESQDKSLIDKYIKEFIISLLITSINDASSDNHSTDKLSDDNNHAYNQKVYEFENNEELKFDLLYLFVDFLRRNYLNEKIMQRVIPLCLKLTNNSTIINEINIILEENETYCSFILNLTKDSLFKLSDKVKLSILDKIHELDSDLSLHLIHKYLDKHHCNQFLELFENVGNEANLIKSYEFFNLINYSYQVKEINTDTIFSVRVNNDFDCLTNLQKWNYGSLQLNQEFSDSTQQLLHPLIFYLRHKMTQKVIFNYSLNVDSVVFDHQQNKFFLSLSQEREIQKLFENRPSTSFVNDFIRILSLNPNHSQKQAQNENNEPINEKHFLLKSFLSKSLISINSNNFHLYNLVNVFKSYYLSIYKRGKITELDNHKYIEKIKCISISPQLSLNLINDFETLCQFMNKFHPDQEFESIYRKVKYTNDIAKSLREEIKIDLDYQNEEKSIENLLIAIFLIDQIEEQLITPMFNTIEKAFNINNKNEIFFSILATKYLILKPIIPNLLKLISSVPFHFSQIFIELICKDEVFKPLLTKIHPGFSFDLVQKGLCDNKDLVFSIETFLNPLKDVLSQPRSTKLLRIHQTENKLIEKIQSYELHSSNKNSTNELEIDLEIDLDNNELNHELDSQLDCGIEWSFASSHSTMFFSRYILPLPVPLIDLKESVFYVTCFSKRTDDKFLTATFSLINGKQISYILAPFKTDHNFYIFSYIVSKVLKMWPESRERHQTLTSILSSKITENFFLINSHDAEPLYTNSIVHSLKKYISMNKINSSCDGNCNSFLPFNFSVKEEYCEWFWHFGSRYSAISAIQHCLMRETPLPIEIFISKSKANAILLTLKRLPGKFADVNHEDKTYPRMCGRLGQFCSKFVRNGPFKQGIVSTVDCLLQNQYKLNFLLSSLIDEPQEKIFSFFNDKLLKYSARSGEYDPITVQQNLNDLVNKSYENKTNYIIPWV